MVFIHRNEDPTKTILYYKLVGSESITTAILCKNCIIKQTLQKIKDHYFLVFDTEDSTISLSYSIWFVLSLFFSSMFI